MGLARVDINLDDREKVKNFMREHLLECKKYLGAKNVSLRLIKDIDFNLFRQVTDVRAGRVLVYDAEFDNNLEAFATIGGWTYPHDSPCANSFLKTEIQDANVAAKVHIYNEVKNFYPDFSNSTAFGYFAGLLEIPLEFRVTIN